MADITRDTFDASKLYQKLIFQKDRPVPEFELNELQDIARYQHASKAIETNSRGVVNAKSLRVVGTGANNDVTVEAGSFDVHGEQYILPTSKLLSELTAAAPLPTNVGAPRYDWVYADFQELEIGPLTDPNIAVGALGETARRRQLVGTWGVSIGAPPAASPGAGELILGGVQRVVFARVYRPTGQAAVNAYEVTLYTRPTYDVEALFRHNMMIASTPSCWVVWDDGLNELSIGDFTDWESGSQGLMIVHAAGGTFESLYGQWTIPDNSVLVFRPTYCGTVTQQVLLTSDTTPPFQVDTFDTPIAVLPLDSFDLSSQYVVLAVNTVGALFLADGSTSGGASFTRMGWGVDAAILRNVSSTTRAVQVASDTSGRRIESSPVIIDLSGNVDGVADIEIDGTVTLGEEVVYDGTRNRITVIEAIQGQCSGPATDNYDPASLLLKNDFAYWNLPLNRYLPHGAVIKRIRALVDPGAGRVSPNGMQMSLYRPIYQFAPEISGYSLGGGSFTINDNGGSGLQTLDSGTVTITLDNDEGSGFGTGCVLSIRAGNTAVSNFDRIHAVQIDWIDPGPRNY